MKKLLDSLFSPFSQCSKYDIPLWQCPPFLFVIMGGVIIIAILVTYFIASLKIQNPTTVSLIVMGATVVLLIFDYIITKSFEKIAEANRMKTEFINIVSHQLRGPLTNLKFSFEVLTEQKIKNISQDQKEYFEIIQENIQRMGELVNNLLTVSRIETGRLPLKEQEFSLTEVVKDVILKFKSQAEKLGVKIIFKGGNNFPKVKGDQFWTEQVVQNLLDNALHYTPRGGWVEIKIFKKSPKFLCFQIKDNGIGIPKNEQKYIFQKFFRSQNVMKRKSEGSGLGLYIGKKVIELMNGRIWFKSQEGKGTTFYFILPTQKLPQKV